MNIREVIVASTHECLELAREKYPRYKEATAPQVTFFEKGKTLGWARGHIEVSFNLAYFKQRLEFFSDIIIPHEVAHVVSVFLYGRHGYGHGRHWQDICTALGGDGERLAVIPSDVVVVPARTMKQYEHIDTAGKRHLLSAIMHNKVLNGQTRTSASSGGLITSSTFTGKIIHK